MKDPRKRGQRLSISGFFLFCPLTVHRTGTERQETDASYKSVKTPGRAYAGTASGKTAAHPAYEEKRFKTVFDQETFP